MSNNKLPAELIALISSYFPQEEFASYLSLGMTCKRYNQLLLIPIIQDVDHLSDDEQSKGKWRQAQRLVAPFRDFKIVQDHYSAKIYDTVGPYNHGKYQEFEFIHTKHWPWETPEMIQWKERLGKTTDQNIVAAWLLNKENPCCFLRALATYKCGRINGKKRVWSQTGKKRERKIHLASESFFVNGLPHGLFTSWETADPASRTEIGMYDYEKKIGQWDRLFYSQWMNRSNLYTREFWLNGTRVQYERFGSWRELFPDESFTCVGDQKEGWHYKWHANGVMISKCWYHENKREGLCEEWYTDGIKRANYLYSVGRKHGMQFDFQPHTGVPWAIAMFSNGQKDGMQIEFHMHSEIIAKRFWQKQDVLHGEYEAFHSDGGLHFRNYYHEGRLHGESLEWYTGTGIMRSRENMRGGRFHGLCEYFYDSGIRQLSQMWDEGKLVHEQRWQASDDDEESTGLLGLLYRE